MTGFHIWAPDKAAQNRLSFVRFVILSFVNSTLAESMPAYLIHEAVIVVLVLNAMQHHGMRSGGGKSGGGFGRGSGGGTDLGNDTTAMLSIFGTFAVFSVHFAQKMAAWAVEEARCRRETKAGAASRRRLAAQRVRSPSKFRGTPDCNEGAALHSYGLESHCRSVLRNPMTDAIILDNVAADATAFGEFDADGKWRATDPTALLESAGANSVWLDFKDASNLGKDVSGKGNDFAAYGSPLQVDGPGPRFPPTVTDVNVGGADYRLTVFKNSGTYHHTSGGNVDIFLIGGGGGTGGSITSSHYGGGGAGGAVFAESYALSAGSYEIVVGAGGSGGPYGLQSGVYGFNQQGQSGGDTIAFGWTAKGGGRGGGYFQNWNANPGPPADGGCGGGSSNNDAGGASTQASYAGVTSYGNIGGHRNFAGDYTAAGGGGIGGPGLINSGGGSAGGPGKDMSAFFGTGFGESGWFGGGARHDSAEHFSRLYARPLHSWSLIPAYCFAQLHDRAADAATRTDKARMAAPVDKAEAEMVRQGEVMTRCLTQAEAAAAANGKTFTLIMQDIQVLPAAAGSSSSGKLCNAVLSQYEL